MLVNVASIELMDQVAEIINNSKDTSIWSHIIANIITCMFFLFRGIVTEQENPFVKKKMTLRIINRIIIALPINVIALFAFGDIAMLLVPIFGILGSTYVYGKFFNNKNEIKERESPVGDDKKSKDEEIDKDIEIDDYSTDPNLTTIPEALKNVHYKNIDIITVLDQYGYISTNQRYKLVLESLYETPDQMVNKLLTMSAITQLELNEARAILNLMDLRKRVVTKEEAQKFITAFVNGRIHSFSNQIEEDSE